MTGLRSNILYPLFLIIGIFALYHSVVHNEFSGLDDILMIRDNWDNLTDLNHIKTAFTEDVFNGVQGTYYRPIQVLSYMPDAFIANSINPEPRIFFELNLAFFIGAFVLLYFFLKEFGFSANFRFIFTALMALHPTLTPAVAWIPGRVDIILFLVVISAIWAFIRFTKTNNRVWIWVHLLFFTLGMFTKETSIVIPVICLLLIIRTGEYNSNTAWSWKIAIDLHYWKSIITSSFKWLITNYLFSMGWFMSLLIWFILRKNALPDNPFGIMGIFYQISSSYRELIILGGTIFFPYNLQVFLDITNEFVYWAIPGFIIFIGLPSILKTNFRDAFWGFLWMFLFIFPTTLSEYLNYHRMFLPLVGMAFLLKPLDKPIAKQKWVIGMVATLTLLLFWQNITFQKAFPTKEVFWKNALTYSPHSAFANNGLAWSYHVEHENDSALKYYQKVIDITPERENVRMGMAIIQEELGNQKMADSLLQSEFIATKDSSQVYFYIGQILLERGDTLHATENLVMGLPSTKRYRNARLFYDSLDVSVRNKMNRF